MSFLSLAFLEKKLPPFFGQENEKICYSARTRFAFASSLSTPSTRKTKNSGAYSHSTSASLSPAPSRRTSLPPLESDMRSTIRPVRQGVAPRSAAAPASAAGNLAARGSDVVSRRRRPIVAVWVATRPGSSSTTLREEASAAAAALERSLALPSEVNGKLDADPGDRGGVAFDSPSSASSSTSSVAPRASTSSASTTSSPPTISLADRKNPGASADELTSTWEHRAWVAGTSALLLALAAQGVGKCLHDAEGGGGGLTSVAAALGLSYLLSDFLTAVYHWSVDNYGDGSTPIVGGQIAAFQGHHQVN